MATGTASKLTLESVAAQNAELAKNFAEMSGMLQTLMTGILSQNAPKSEPVAQTVPTQQTERTQAQFRQVAGLPSRGRLNSADYSRFTHWQQTGELLDGVQSAPVQQRNANAAVDAQNVKLPDYAMTSQFWFNVSKMGANYNGTENLVNITPMERRFARSMQLSYASVEDAEAKARMVARGDSRVNGPTPKMLTSKLVASIIEKTRSMHNGGRGEATDEPVKATRRTRQATPVQTQTPANLPAVSTREATNDDKRAWHDALTPNAKGSVYYTKRFAQLAAQLGVVKTNGKPVGANGIMGPDELAHFQTAISKPRGRAASK